jgi:hypothetical protein
MTVRLTFEFDNIHQATEFCVRCAPHATERAVKENPSVSHPIVTPPEATSIVFDENGVKAAQPEPKRRGRPPKAQPVPADNVKASAETAAESAPAAAPVEFPKHEEAIAAQKALYDAKSADACIAVLQRHGANRISEIKPEQRARFIQDCNDALAGKDLSAAA